MNMPYSAGVKSGTDAIKLSLKALGERPGDEVFTAANTLVATISVINEIGICELSFQSAFNPISSAHSSSIGNRLRSLCMMSQKIAAQNASFVPIADLRAGKPGRMIIDMNL